MIDVNNGVSYKIAVCDDDMNHVEYIRDLIRECFTGKLESFMHNSGERLLRSSGVMYDALFIDIQLGRIDGAETVRRLRTRNRNAVLVFCSGVVDPTPEPIEVTPYRFLLKQSDGKIMRREVTEILGEMVRSYKEEYILARTEEGLVRIYVSGIACISKARRGGNIHLLESEKYEVKDELLANLHASVLYERLHKYGFEFAHNGYLVDCK